MVLSSHLQSHFVLFKERMFVHNGVTNKAGIAPVNGSNSPQNSRTFIKQSRLPDTRWA